MKKLFIALFFIAVCSVFLQAQEIITTSRDTTIVVEYPDAFPVGGGFVAILNWFLANWTSIVGALSTIVIVLELLLRAVPSKGNNSILLKVIQFLDRIKVISIFKNRAVGGAEHKTYSKTES